MRTRGAMRGCGQAGGVGAAAGGGPGEGGEADAVSRGGEPGAGGGKRLAAAGGDAHGLVEPARCCSPHHRILVNSLHKGSEYAV